MTYRGGVTLTLAAAVLWSLLGLAIRQIEVAGTWQILFFRSLGMVPVLFGSIALRSGGRPLAAISSAGLPGLIGGLALVFAFAGSIFAMQTTTVANAVFLFAAAPLVSAVLAWALLGEPVRRATWAAIALAVVGMFVMVRDGLAAGALWGNVAALVCATGFAVFTVTLRWGRLADMLPAVLIGSCLALCAAAAMALFQGQGLSVPARDAAIAMGMGAGLVGFGMALYVSGSRVISAAELGLLSMVEILLAPVWVWLVLGETASPALLAGAAIVSVAIIFNAASGMRHRPPKLI